MTDLTVDPPDAAAGDPLPGLDADRRALAAERARIEGLADDLTTLAAHINAGLARFLALLAEFDRSKGWASAGILSLAHWLNYRCGIGAVAARECVRVARALTGLPLIREAFASGEASYSKVRAMTRVSRMRARRSRPRI